MIRAIETDELDVWGEESGFPWVGLGLVVLVLIGLGDCAARTGAFAASRRAGSRLVRSGFNPHIAGERS